MHDSTLAKTGNLPTDIQALIDAAVAGYVDFPDRNDQWQSIENSLCQGDHHLATILLKSLCKQQDNLRNYNQH